jgi:hypothetical protein
MEGLIALPCTSFAGRCDEYPRFHQRKLRDQISGQIESPVLLPSSGEH